MIERMTYFFTDLHADKEAFVRSLSYCEEPSALYLVGGDCLDKGPSNLELLSAIKTLSNIVEIKLLAGNHDLRMLMVLQNWDNRDDPQLKEIFTSKRYKKRIMPFLDECGGVEKAKEMFLNPDGEFGWFFESLNLFHRDNGLLFVHAGITDASAAALKKDGFDGVHDQFKSQIKNKEQLHKLYYGHLGAMFRTKYRKKDYPFTDQGANALKDLGVNYVVHGHNSRTGGHEKKYRHGIPHLMCDCTIDVNSRKKKGIGDESGFSLTVFDNNLDYISYYGPESIGQWVW